MTEYVYLIGCEANTLVKIGRSTDVQERFAELQRMSPAKLTLLWQTVGGAELETILHRHFKDQRSHGEWFDFPDRNALRQVLEVVGGIFADEEMQVSLCMNEEELRAVEDIPDPIQRIRQVGRILQHQRQAAIRLAAIRRRAITEARQVMSLKDVANDLGVTPGRVSQLANGWTSSGRKRGEPRI